MVIFLGALTHKIAPMVQADLEIKNLFVDSWLLSGRLLEASE
jgi:hypothetical protein